jgi:hypothetical protein
VGANDVQLKVGKVNGSIVCGKRLKCGSATWSTRRACPDNGRRCCGMARPMERFGFSALA